MSTVTLRPNAAGDLTELFVFGAASNYLAVDEVSPDDDTTYVYNSSDGSVNGADLYNFNNHTIESGEITDLTVYIYAKTLGTGQYDIFMKTGGTQYTKGAGNLTGSYATYSKSWTSNPQSGLLWTWADIDAIQAGGYLFDITGSASRITQVYTIITYTPFISKVVITD